METESPRPLARGTPVFRSQGDLEEAAKETEKESPEGKKKNQESMMFWWPKAAGSAGKDEG